MTTSSPDTMPGRLALWPLPELSWPNKLGPAPDSGPGPGPGPDPVADAYARGRADAEAAARAEADRRVRGSIAVLHQAAAAVREMGSTLTHDLADHLHSLSLAIAKQLVQREIVADPSIMAELVRQALELVPQSGQVRLRLHPDDLRALTPWRSEIDSRDGSDIDWMADPGIERGGCLAETPHRVIDGRLDESLVALFDRIRHD